MIPHTLAGINVFVDRNLCEFRWEQSRYPKSRKKRVRLKFRKKYGKWVMHPACYQTPIGLIMHPIVFEKLQDLLIAKGTEQFQRKILLDLVGGATPRSPFVFLDV